MSRISSLGFIFLQCTSGDLPTLHSILSHSTRPWLKVWNKFRAVFQDSWRPCDKGFLVVDLFFLDSLLPQNFFWSMLLRHTYNEWDYFGFPPLILVLEVCGDSYIVVLLTPTAFMVTVSINFIMFLSVFWIVLLKCSAIALSWGGASSS